MATFQKVMEKIMKRIPNMRPTGRDGGKVVFGDVVNFVNTVIPNGFFDESAFEIEMKKIDPETAGTNNRAKREKIKYARKFLYQLRLFLNDMMTNAREDHAGGNVGDCCKVGPAQKSTIGKKRWEDKSPYEKKFAFTEALLWFADVLHHFAEHLDKLKDELSPVTELRDEVPLAIESPPQPLFKVGDKCEVKGVNRLGIVDEVHSDGAKFWYDVQSTGRALDKGVREVCLRRVDSGGGASAEPQKPKNEHRFKVGDIVQLRPQYQYGDDSNFAVKRVYRDDDDARIFDMESSLDKGSKVYLAKRQILFQRVAGS